MEKGSPEWTKFGRNHPLWTHNRKISSKFRILKSVIAAGRHFENTENAKTPKDRNPSTDCHQILTRSSFWYPRHDFGVKNDIFAKSNMAAALLWKLTYMTITSKRLVLNGRNFAEVILFESTIGKFHKNFEFHSPIWLPAAVMIKTNSFVNIS